MRYVALASGAHFRPAPEANNEAGRVRQAGKRAAACAAASSAGLLEALEKFKAAPSSSRLSERAQRSYRAQTERSVKRLRVSTGTDRQTDRQTELLWQLSLPNEAAGLVERAPARKEESPLVEGGKRVRSSSTLCQRLFITPTSGRHHESWMNGDGRSKVALSRARGSITAALAQAAQGGTSKPQQMRKHLLGRQ